MGLYDCCSGREFVWSIPGAFVGEGTRCGMLPGKAGAHALEECIGADRRVSSVVYVGCELVCWCS